MSTAFQNETTESWPNRLKAMFASAGFVTCPLSDDQLRELFWHPAVTTDVAYGIGCDVAAGFTFGDAFHANIPT